MRPSTLMPPSLKWRKRLLRARDLRHAAAALMGFGAGGAAIAERSVGGGEAEVVGRGMGVLFGINRVVLVNAATRPITVAARADTRRAGMEAAAAFGAAATAMGLVAAGVAAGRMGMAATLPLPPTLELVLVRLTWTSVRGWEPEWSVTLVPLPPSPALGEVAGPVAGAPRRARMVPVERSEDAAAGSLRRRGEDAGAAGQAKVLARVEQQAQAAAASSPDSAQATGAGVVSVTTAVVMVEAGTMEGGVEAEMGTVLMRTEIGMGGKPPAVDHVTGGRCWIGLRPSTFTFPTTRPGSCVHCRAGRALSFSVASPRS